MNHCGIKFIAPVIDALNVHRLYRVLSVGLEAYIQDFSRAARHNGLRTVRAGVSALPRYVALQFFWEECRMISDCSAIQWKSLMYVSSTAKRWIGIMIALQAMILLTLWGGNLSPRTARADGIPDAGAQRDQMIQEQKSTNQKLDKLLALLSGGDLKVTVSKSEETDKH
jgi:hypothetical protein